MKKTFLILLLLQINALNAQKPGSNYPEDVNQPEEVKIPKIQEFIPHNAAGALKYKTIRVIKKIKISKQDKANNVIQLIAVYNNEIDAILLSNKHILNVVEVYVDKKIESAMRYKDYTIINQIYREGQEKLLPLKNQIEAKERSLNSKMETLLTEKQYKKWLSYQKNQKKKLKSN